VRANTVTGKGINQMIDLDISQLHTWVYECGQIARGHFRNVNASQKADRSFVTAADLEIEHFLVERLSTQYPTCGIIGEELTRSNLDREYVWAIDPIDGTGAFVHGLPIWGISLGLLRNGMPYYGMFYMPIPDELYWNEPDGAAFFNEKPIQVIDQRAWDSEDWIAVPSNTHRRYMIDFLGKARSFGSSVADICAVARGSALGSLLTRCAIWDLAAGLAILNAAGGVYSGLSGSLPDLPQMARDGSVLTEPLVVSGTAHINALRASITIR
jgi:myo-inositol-1(or 4)-monophosphatase